MPLPPTTVPKVAGYFMKSYHTQSLSIVAPALRCQLLVRLFDSQNGRKIIVLFPTLVIKNHFSDLLNMHKGNCSYMHILCSCKSGMFIISATIGQIPLSEWEPFHQTQWEWAELIDHWTTYMGYAELYSRNELCQNHSKISYPFCSQLYFISNPFLVNVNHYLVKAHL